MDARIPGLISSRSVSRIDVKEGDVLHVNSEDKKHTVITPVQPVRVLTLATDIQLSSQSEKYVSPTPLSPHQRLMLADTPAMNDTAARETYVSQHASHASDVEMDDIVQADGVATFRPTQYARLESVDQIVTS